MPLVTREDIVDVSSNYLGKSYGNWVVEWNNWLVSADRESQRGPVFFLRGSIYADDGKYEPYIATGSNAVQIDSQTGIFLPIMSSTAFTGAFPNLTTHAMRLDDVRNDIRGGVESSLFFRGIEDQREHDILTTNQILQHYTESPPFMLEVPEVNLVEPRRWDTVPLSAGTSDAVCAGYYILIKPLPANNEPYILHFGGNGKRPYNTSSLYEIYVTDSVSRPVALQTPTMNREEIRNALPHLSSSDR
jgi:hypothetical protein